MKVLLSLNLLCITLALCQAYCFQVMPETEIKNDVVMHAESCIDIYDGSTHPSGSKWNTQDCVECSCHAGSMQCCTRYGGIAVAPEGCEAVVDPNECRYKLHRKGKPSEPCFHPSALRFLEASRSK